jgi:tRNA (guanine37-N1)-methyltransferase
MARQSSLRITIITLFPEFIEAYSRFGIIAKAIKHKLFILQAINLRQFGVDERQTVDDRPYGGGVGMVLRPDVMLKAIQSAIKRPSAVAKKQRVILLTPQGKQFKQADAKRLTRYDRLVFISGRYEGFDERIRQFVDEEISIGDYVLMGGELPALVVSEAVLRLVPGVIGKLESTTRESFADGMLEYPQYTKPEVLKIGKKAYRVPKVLLTGHHRNIDTWRQQEAQKRTKKRRPDLWKESGSRS